MSLFWDVREQEKEIRDRLERDVASSRAALEAAQQVGVLRDNRAFQMFVGRLEELHQDGLTRLVVHKGPDHETRLLQGQCQGIKAVLDLCRKTGLDVEALAHRHRHAQDALASAVRPDGRVVPQGILP